MEGEPEVRWKMEAWVVLEGRVKGRKGQLCIARLAEECM